jgi:hypothetical protein
MIGSVNSCASNPYASNQNIQPQQQHAKAQQNSEPQDTVQLSAAAQKASAAAQKAGDVDHDGDSH